MEKTILRIDPSTLANSSCLEKVRLSNVCGYTGKTPDHKIDFGTGFHKAIEAWYKTGSEEAALQAAKLHSSTTKTIIPTDDYRNGLYLWTCVKGYIDRYGKYDSFKLAMRDGVPAVELPFKIPFRAYETVDVILCGVIDAIGYENNKPCFKDIKTTAAYNPLAYFRSYDVSIQMMIYSWVLKQLGWADYYPPVIIDGIFLSERGVKFIRSSPVTYRKDLVEECMLWVSQKVDEIVSAIEGRSQWTKNFSACSGKYGMCDFFLHCSVQEAYRENILNNNFDTRVYDPEKFHE